jgi:hypothetical protein
MSDEYLWDGSGTPDRDVQRLEQLLGRLKSSTAAPRLPVRVAAWRTPRFLAPALTVAAAVLLLVGVTWRDVRDVAMSATPSWEVASLAGRPRIGSTLLAGTGRLAVGQTLVTDAASRARVDISTIGQVTIDGNTHVRLVDTRDAHHQLALERGTLHALIIAPPGQFVVDTPSATATDLGCIYTLHVDEDGSGLLSVTAGWVAFEFNGRETFVPAGASCRTAPRRGPGTPSYDDAGAEMQAALEEFDHGTDTGARHDALGRVLAHARERDAMTLWHLIPRVDAADRAAVVDALESSAPMPASVTREAVMRLDKAALDRWWDALGLGETSWWRIWKRPYLAPRGSW